MSKWIFEKFMPFFEADGGAGGQSGNSGGGEGQNDDPAAQGQKSKLFTQDDLNRVAAQEKRQSQAALLKSLGFDDEKSAKSFLEQARKDQESKKTELEKAQDALGKEQAAKTELEDKVTALERSLAVISAGVPAENASDVAMLAASKMTDGKSFEDGLEEVKKAYPMLFDKQGQNGQAGGTGTGGTPPRGSSRASGGELGKRIAEQRTKNNNSNQNLYFQD